jgi:hypothetical protein
MIQAALKEEMTVPSGGIADFYLNDDEFEAFEREEAQKEFGNNGLAQFEPLAKKMASYGRFGDDVVIHAERGELVVPKALIEDNPELKDSIFSHLRELGVEDPERYVVGSSANSLNPTTGMPEFFLKKLFRGVKKAFKSVGKVLKKVAPMVLPIALNVMFPGMGTIMSGALGAGLGTLIQGGSVKDAFKSALLGGATGALYSGASSALKGGTFMEGVKGGLPGAQQAVAQQAAAQQATAAAAPVAPSDLAQSQLDAARFAPAPDAASPTFSAAERIDAFGVKPLRTGFEGNTVTAPYEVPSVTESATNIITGGGDGRFAAAKDLFMPAGPTPAQVTLAGNQAYTTAYQNALALPGMTPELAASQATKAMQAVTAESLGPSMARAYGPAALAATGAAVAGGAFDKPDEEPEEERMGVEEYYTQDPARYGLSSFQNYTPPPMLYPGSRPSPYAEGGQVFPRRNGGIMPNEGIPNQDSVRAMLMPGEFVMTTDAVRGLGNGSLNNGINNMYNMMRNLESRGRAFA